MHKDEDTKMKTQMQTKTSLIILSVTLLPSNRDIQFIAMRLVNLVSRVRAPKIEKHTHRNATRYATGTVYLARLISHNTESVSFFQAEKDAIPYG